MFTADSFHVHFCVNSSIFGYNVGAIDVLLLENLFEIDYLESLAQNRLKKPRMF
jgi:hypothetical protein